jgi:mono/diheme cytochrome c family protein
MLSLVRERMRVSIAVPLLLAVLVPRLGQAQPAGVPADGFQKNAAWSLAETVTLGSGATTLETTAGDSARILVLSAAKPEMPQLRSVAYLGDSVLRLEYLLTADARAGLYLEGRYRIELGGDEAGALGPMLPNDQRPAGPTTLPPLRAVSSPAGGWRTLEATFRAPRFDAARNKTQNALLMEVKIDGQVLQANTLASGWSRGTESPWEDAGGNTSIAVEAGGLAIRAFSLRRADFSAVELPKVSGQPSNAASLVDYVKRGDESFRALGCIECHAVQAGDTSEKSGPNLFGLFKLEPRDRQIASGPERHRFTIKASRAYLHRSLRTPADELAVAERGPTAGAPYPPAMPPYLPTAVSDAQVDAIGAYLASLNEGPSQGPVVQLVRETGLESYDPMADRLQMLVDRTVRIQRGPMERVSGRAIHVGLPSGINYSFDPRVLGIARLWQGGFLDLSGELQNRGGGGLKPGYESREIQLGDAAVLLAPLDGAGQAIDFSFKDAVFKDAETVRAALESPRDPLDRLAEVDAQFLGYRRDSSDPVRAPVFRYRVGKNTVDVQTDIAADGQVRVSIDAQIASPQTFRVNEALLGVVKVSAGQLRDGRWTLPVGTHRAATALGRLAVAPAPWHPRPSAFDHLLQPLVTGPSKADLPRGYTAEGYLGPKDNYGREQLFEALGMAVAPDGTVVVATRTAGIWRLVNREWRLFAEGTFDSLGVQIEDAHGLVLVVGQKPELTRIRDTNGDGLADQFDTLTDAFSYNGNYHAYMHGPVRDAHGDYMIALNLDDSSRSEGEYKAGGRFMGTGGGYRGWAIRVPAKGGFEPWADGLRSPAGLGIAPDGRLWYADNQGEYVGTSKIHVLERGSFYGHPAGLVDRPGMTPASPEIAWERVQDKVKPAVVLLPQSRLANSPGNPAWDTTSGRFGPFAGQMFIGDQTQSNVMRVTTERVGDHEQGAAINFATGLESGVMRPLFLPDGSLLLGETGRGWQAKGGRVASLQHIRWDGKTTPPAIHHVRAVAGGFELMLTAPIPRGLSDADVTAALAIRSWVYRDAPDYGSPELDQHAEAVTQVAIGADRSSLRVTLAKTEQPRVHPQQTARVYELTLSGPKLWGEEGPGFQAFYTLYGFPAAAP